MKIKKIAALLLAAAMALSLAACHGGKMGKAGKTINYYLSDDPSSLDPQIASDPSSLIVVQSLFEGLTRLDAKETAQPGVAEKWEQNADATQFTFHLRKDAKWPGKAGAVKASDFVFAFRRALDPATGSSTCLQMYCIKNAREIHEGKLPVNNLGVEAPDTKTLVVNLAYPCPDFPKMAASAVFMPCNETFFDSTEGRYGLETDEILGNGPFKIDGSYGWTHGKSINLTKSSTYAGRTVPLPSAVNFTIGLTAADLSNPVEAMAAASLDAAPIPASKISEAEAKDCTISSVQDTTWGLGFNVQSSPFSNEKVRAAFLQAISRSAVLAHLPGDSSAAENLILPHAELDGNPSRSAAGGPFYLKQSANASLLLNEGLQEAGVKDISSITVYCPNDSADKMMCNEMIAAWNRTFNNYFNIKPMDASRIVGAVQSGDYSIAVYPVTPSSDGPYAFLSMFLSTSSDNPAGLKDAGYDALVESAQGKSGQQAAQGYAAAERYLNEKAIFYPLYYGKSYYAVAKGVTGIVFHPYGGGVDFINAGKG